MQATPINLATDIGRVVLFVGQECRDWTPQDFANASAYAHGLGVDTLVAKRADGGIKWYGDVARLREERAAVQNAGCGYLAFGYCYGPKFQHAGNDQIAIECGILQEMASVCDNIAVADMEAEWNGQTGAAQEFYNHMRPWPGRLIVSTLADPNQQDWRAVVETMRGCVDAWGPQQYNNWLDNQEWQLSALGETVVFPEFDLSQEFGANDHTADVRNAVARGQKSLWFWEYGFSRSNPDLVKQLAALVHGDLPKVGLDVQGIPTAGVPISLAPQAPVPARPTVSTGSSTISFAPQAPAPAVLPTPAAPDLHAPVDLTQALAYESAQNPPVVNAAPAPVTATPTPAQTRTDPSTVVMTAYDSLQSIAAAAYPGDAGGVARLLAANPHLRDDGAAHIGVVVTIP